MNKLFSFLICLAFAMAFNMGAWCSNTQADEITVYTSYEEDEAAAFLAAFNRDNPDIRVNLLRLSTGDLHARMLAERANPRHDVIWGWAVTNMVDPRIMEMLEPYEPRGIEKVPARFRDPGNRWFAKTGYMAAFCVNNEILKRRNLPMPESWEDLLRPEFKGEVVMPNPASSGTGYLMIASILQMKGEEKGWEYLEKLDSNIAQYIKSGSRPCNSASAGEFAVGASFALRAIKNIEEGFPITMIIPAEGAGNELEATGLMKSSRNKEAAKRFIDWTLSENAVNEYYKWKEIVTVEGGTMPKSFIEAGLPKDMGSVMVDMDFPRNAAMCFWCLPGPVKSETAVLYRSLLLALGSAGPLKDALWSDPVCISCNPCVQPNVFPNAVTKMNHLGHFREKKVMYFPFSTSQRNFC